MQHLSITLVSQLADPSRPKRKFVGVTAEQLTVLEIEFDALNDECLYCASSRGVWTLGLMLGRSYLDRLMENARVTVTV